MGKKYFDTPKSCDLMARLVDFSCLSNDIVLDFFSGSASMAASILQKNSSDSTNLRFIMVQLPEPTFVIENGIKIAKKDTKIAFNDGFETIAEIGKERIRRTAKMIMEDNPLFAGDIGFKVFKLDTSNFVPWNPEPDEIELHLRNAVENILIDRTRQDLLYEVLLKCNLPLTLPIEEKKFGENTVYIVGAGALAICLDTKIPQMIAEEIVT